MWTQPIPTPDESECPDLFHRFKPSLSIKQMNKKNKLSDLSKQHRSLDRVRRNALNPAHVLRLLKQPAGVSRTAVRAADYMENAVILVKRSLERRQRRSVNATGAFVDLFGGGPMHDGDH